MSNGQHGFVIVDKPSGWTSHDVVARLRKLAGTKKVGHAGTLDPMATGVLVCGIGGATRLLGRITLTDKEYEATIRLGYSTTTDDAQGEVVAVAPPKWSPETVANDRAKLTATLSAFTGEIMQRPSSVSAIKVDGKRAYARVRAGEDVVLPERGVTVSEFTLKSVSASTIEDLGIVDLDVVVGCSSGTYVRSLARDVGESLGVHGHLSALRRTRVGPFELGRASTLDDLASDFKMQPLGQVCDQLFTTLDLSSEDAVIVRHGGRLPWPKGIEKSRSVALFDESHEVLALAECRNDQLAPVVVWAPA